MADLRPDNRGQLIVIAGLLLAITFVALALILNSVIFTENLATRSQSLGGSGPEGSQEILRTSVGTLMGFVNANNNSGPTDLETEIEASVEDLGNITNKESALAGQFVEVEYLSKTDGTRIWHNDSTQVFDTDGPKVDWDLVTGVEQVRDFGLRINRSSLSDESDFSNCGSTDCFRANVTNESNGRTWGVAVFNDSGVVNVTSFNTDGPIGHCTVDEQVVDVNLTTGWVGDKRCTAVKWGEGINVSSSTPKTLNFTNGDKANGTYSVIVRDTDSKSTFDPTLSSGSDPPFKSDALYSVTIRATYRTDRITYEFEEEVAPGEP